MSSHSAIVTGYLREAPRAYTLVVFLGVLVGLIEMAGITSLVPVAALMLGEQSGPTPKIIGEILAFAGPQLVVGSYVLAVLFQAAIAFVAESYFLHGLSIWRTNLSMDYIRGILGADFSTLAALKPGEAEVIITRNTTIAVRNRYKTALLLIDGILAIFYGVIALLVSPYTFLLFVLLGAIYGPLNRRMLRLQVEHSQNAAQSYLATAQTLAEYLQDMRGLMTVRRNVLEHRMSHELDRASVSQRTNEQVNAGVRLSSQPIMLALVIAGVAGSKFFLDVPNATLMMMLYVFYRAAPRLIALARGYAEIIQDSPGDVTPEIKRWAQYRRASAPAPAIDAAAPVISLSDAGLCYQDQWVLRHATVLVQRGELVALVGRSGSGKSTLLDLVCGFVRPQEGQVRLWGLDPVACDYESLLLPKVALLRPESTIVSGSLIDNIAFLEEQPDRARIGQLVTQMGLDGLLDRDGLDTRLNARGGNLSAGQRQRILLARALYKQPELLILDEPTSNLDRRTEDDINALLASLKGNITILVVSHRAGILASADRIYHFEEGQVTQETLQTLRGHE